MPRVPHRLSVAGLFCLATLAHAHEPPTGLLMHLPLDGSLADASGNGFSGDYIGGGGILASEAPEFREGKAGQALYFDGNHGLRIPLDLAPEVHPTITVTAWVYQEADGSGSPIFTHGHKSLRLLRKSDHAVELAVIGTGGSIYEDVGFRPKRWHFIAATIDTTSGQVSLQIDRRGQSKAFDPSAYRTPYRDVWFGTVGDAVDNTLTGYRLDDLRIYDRVLTDEELEGLALGQSDAGDATGATSPTSTASSAQVDCQPVYHDVWSQLDSRVVDLRMAAYQFGQSGCELAGLKNWWDTRGEPGGLPPLSVSWDEFEHAYAEVGVPAEQAASSTATSGETASMTPERVSGGTTSALSGSEIGQTNPTVEASRSLGEEFSQDDSERASSGVATSSVTAVRTSEFEAARVPTALDEMEAARTAGGSGTTSSTKGGNDTANDEASGTVSGWRLSATESVLTGIAGQQGDDILPQDLVNSPLYEIKIDEADNIPCRLSFSGSGGTEDHFDNVGTGIDKCEGFEGGLIFAGTELIAQLDAGAAAIGAIAVCAANPEKQNYRIKGIEVRGNVVNSDGSLGAYQQDLEKLVNCDDQDGWSRLVVCPDQHLATGLVSHFRDRKGHDELVGLQLICREIEKIYN